MYRTIDDLEKIEKKMKVPTNVTVLFKNPMFNPTIRLVAAAINAILVMMRKVAPPFDITNEFAHATRPPSNIETSGIMLPPLIAKFTELNIPPITKKNKKIFTIDRFMGLRISDGFTALSVILVP